MANRIPSKPAMDLSPGLDDGGVVPFQDRLDTDREWGWDQCCRHFERDNDIWSSLRRVAHRLDELGIRYAVIGAMALFHHGYRRVTIDVDLLVTTEGLAAIHDRLGELSCVRPDPNRRSILDRATGVRFDFLITGRFPGNRQPQPVAFPDPALVGVREDEITFVNLATLLTLKLAAGMTGGIHCLKHLGDVVEFIKICLPPADLADQLHPFVRERYREYWRELQTLDPFDLA